VGQSVAAEQDVGRGTRRARASLLFAYMYYIYTYMYHMYTYMYYISNISVSSVQGSVWDKVSRQNKMSGVEPDVPARLTPRDMEGLVR